MYWKNANRRLTIARMSSRKFLIALGCLAAIGIEYAQGAKRCYRLERNLLDHDCPERRDNPCRRLNWKWRKRSSVKISRSERMRKERKHYS